VTRSKKEDPRKEALVEELLAKPVGPETKRRKPSTKDFTKKLEVTGKTLTATIRDAEGTVNEGTAISYLEEEGLTPEDWVATLFRKVKYGNVDQPMESVTFAFRKATDDDLPEALNIDELVKAIRVDRKRKPLVRSAGSHTYIVAIGDMQFGKIDGDGVAGTLDRTIKAIDNAALQLAWYRKRFDIGHVHIAWLGDHIEGFVSQGGSNVWRTVLTLNEQIRLTRRVMLHALLVFGPLADRVTMAAVPGNHGEAVRFNGKGMTRYDDSHDTESLIAVADACKLTPERFEHVEFFVPETDELTVTTELSGTIVAHAHGHQWRPGKHFEWWKGQAFNKGSALHTADVLLAGHLHHEHVDTDGWRTFMQPPAMESESTWWKHATGTTGAPGLVVAITKDGIVNTREVVR